MLHVVCNGHLLFGVTRWVWCTGKCESRFRSVLSGLRQSDGEKYCRGRDSCTCESVLLWQRYEVFFGALRFHNTLFQYRGVLFFSLLCSHSGVSISCLNDRWYFTGISTKVFCSLRCLVLSISYYWTCVLTLQSLTLFIQNLGRMSRNNTCCHCHPGCLLCIILCEY